MVFHQRVRSTSILMNKRCVLLFNIQCFQRFFCDGYQNIYRLSEAIVFCHTTLDWRVWTLLRNQSAIKLPRRDFLWKVLIGRIDILTNYAENSVPKLALDSCPSLLRHSDLIKLEH